MLVRNEGNIAHNDIVRNDILRRRINELADCGLSAQEAEVECPDYLEIEEFVVGSDLTVRIPRTTGETSLGRRFINRTDFMEWIEVNRSELLHKAFEKRLSRLGYPVGADPTIVLEPHDLDVQE